MRWAWTLLLLVLVGACGGPAKPADPPAGPTRFEFAPRFECDNRYVCEASVASDGHARTVIPFTRRTDGKCYGMDGTVVVDEAAAVMRRADDGQIMGTLSTTTSATPAGPVLRCIKE